MSDERILIQDKLKKVIFQLSPEPVEILITPNDKQFSTLTKYVPKEANPKFSINDKFRISVDFGFREFRFIKGRWYAVFASSKEDIYFAYKYYENGEEREWAIDNESDECLGYLISIIGERFKEKYKPILPVEQAVLPIPPGESDDTVQEKKYWRLKGS